MTEQNIEDQKIIYGIAIKSITAGVKANDVMKAINPVLENQSIMLGFVSMALPYMSEILELIESKNKENDSKSIKKVK